MNASAENDDCCTTDCTLQPSSKKCREASGCLAAAYCTYPYQLPLAYHLQTVAQKPNNLTLLRPLLPYAIKHPVPDRVKPSFVMTLSPERQSARMSKISNGGLTRSATGCFIAVPIWQQWASKS